MLIIRFILNVALIHIMLIGFLSLFIFVYPFLFLVILLSDDIRNDLMTKWVWE